jgi:hypothetical protein
MVERRAVGWGGVAAVESPDAGGSARDGVLAGHDGRGNRQGGALASHDDGGGAARGSGASNG